MSLEYADLVKLTQSTNNAERNAAEAKLQQAKDLNPGMFMLIAAREVYNPEQTVHVRGTSAALIKRTITYVPPGGTSVWVTLDNDTRKQIKDYILASLAANEPAVRNLAANLVAEILAIELPLGEWRELIPQLAEKTSDTQVEIKKSAIRTLGEIAAKLKFAPNLLDNKMIESILTGICLGLQPNEANNDIRVLSIKALHESLAFLRVLLEKDDVFRYVIVGVLENCIFNDREVRVSALRCLIDVCKHYYTMIANYVEPLWKATVDLLKSNDSEFAILAMEVWNTIALIDRDRKLGVGAAGKSMAFGNEQNLNITTYVYKNLVIALMENLIVDNNFEKDDGELSIGIASFRTLCSVSEAIGPLYLEYALAFVTKYLNDDNWVNRRAAVLVFNSMVEGSPKDKIVPLITNAIGFLVARVADTKVKVAEMAGIALGKIAEIHPECFLDASIAVKILPLLSQGLKAQPRVSSHIAKAWSHLGEALARHPEGHSLTLDDFILANLENAFRTDLNPSDYSLIDNSLLGVMSLLHCCNNKQTIRKFLEVIITQLENSGSLSGDRKKFIQSGLLSCMQNALLHYEAPPNDALAERSYQTIIALFKSMNDVTADGMHALAGCASAMGTGFAIHMEEAWGLLSVSLQRTNESDLFGACIGALIEISRACPSQFAYVLPKLVPFLIERLNDNNFDRFLKLSIFTAMGDMALGCTELIINYLPQILAIYDMALEAGIKKPSDLTPEYQEYVEQLRDGFIESFICFMHGVEESKKIADLFQYLPKVITFLQSTCVKLYNPTIDYLRNSLALLADVAKFYGKASRAIIDTRFTSELIGILRKASGTKDQKSNQFIIEYADDIFKDVFSN